MSSAGSPPTHPSASSPGPSPTAQRRGRQVEAAVLFADVVGFSQLSRQVGTERAYLAVTGLLELLDATVRRHGGSVDKYLGDRLLAVFGYPIPVEYPSRAAAAAALELRQCVRDWNREARVPLPLRLHVGINTGSLVGGDISGPVTREFHVLGDCVNTAARINARTPDGEIYVGPVTYAETRLHFAYRTLEAFRFKGLSRPVPVFALDAELDLVSDRLDAGTRVQAPLVGRERELAALREAVSRLRKGEGGAVLLVGGEGSGKSRLVAELAPLLGGTGGPGRPGGSSGEPVRNADVDVALARATATGVADLTAVAEGVRARAATRPQLLVVEDAHRLDAESLGRLEGLLRESADLPLLCVASLRPEPAAVAEGLAELCAAALPGRHAALRLDALPDEAARELARAVAAEEALDDETLELVLARGRGNPGRLVMATLLAPSLRAEREQARSRERERSHEAERRRAAVVFADITGFTAMTEHLGARAAYPIVADALELLDRTARAHGGTVDHYLGDCVMALFGVPAALEDAPRAAVNAAIEMRQRIAAYNERRGLEHPLGVHTGIATGLGIAGDISGPLLREFAVMGEHVGIAEELTHLAPSGEIWIDEETWKATRDVFAFGEPAACELRARPEPVAARAVRSTAPARYRAERRIFSELVGREAETARIRERLAAVSRGEGGVVSLMAEAGIGKSRLLAELATSQEAAALAWHTGRSLSNGRNLGFHPFADLLRSWAHIAEGDDSAAARAKLESTIAPYLPDGGRDVMPLLVSLLGVDLTEAEREQLAQIRGDALERLVRTRIAQLLGRASEERPLVLVMEDLHWADQSSLELLESLLPLAAERPLLFVHACRPDFPLSSGRIVAWSREHLPERHLELELAPLDAAAARRLVKNLFRGGDVPQPTRAAIEERARGNPFYIEEVVRNLLDAGAVEWRDGSFHATEKLDTVAIPDTVQDAVMARVDRLDLDKKGLLQAASVVGGTFHLEVLESMLEGDARLAERIEELCEASFLEPSDRLAGVEYAFVHPLIQEVTYDAILQVKREALHLKAARAIEAQLPEGLPGYAAMLAYQFSMGRDADRAEEYLFRAGDEAARSAATSEALHFFRESSRLYFELHGDGGDPAKKARLERSVASALFNRGQLAESLEHFDRALAHLGAAPPDTPLRANLRFASDLARVMLHLYRPQALLRRGGATPTQREVIGAMFQRALSQTTSDPRRFAMGAIATIRHLGQVDPRTVPDAGGMYAGAIGVFSYGGLSFALGRRALDLARRLVEDGGTRELYLYYRVCDFIHHFLAGDWSAAHDLEPERIDEARSQGRLWELTTYLNLDGVRAIVRGRFAPAWERIEQLRDVAESYEHELAHSAAQAMTAYWHLERRELPEALSAVELYRDEHPEPLFQLQAWSTRARIEILRGDGAAAQRSIERAAGSLADAGRVIPYHGSNYQAARYWLDVAGAADAEERREALRRAKRSRKDALRVSARAALRRPEVHRLAGTEAWLRGRADEALSWWSRARELAEELGMQPELGRLYAEVAAHLPSGRRFADLDADACRSEARGHFEACGLGAELEQLESAASRAHPAAP